MGVGSEHETLIRRSGVRYLRHHRGVRGLWTHYFEHLDALKPIASAVLAVLLWPLILFEISLHIK